MSRDVQKHRMAKKAWREKNRDHVRDYGRKYVNAHKEKILENRQKPSRKRAARDGAMRREYGISAEEYDDLLAGQHGRCAICQRPATSFRRALHVDHDHGTGEIRGLLCCSCNRALGYLSDSTHLLQRALSYLGRTLT
jgi:hypothetical protein